MTEEITSNSSENTNNLSAPFLIGLILIGAFIIGSFYTRVKLLESKIRLYENSGQIAGVQAQAPTNPSPLPLNNPQEIKGKVTLNDNDHISGNKNARVLLVEYSDMECPFCKKFHPTAQQIVDNYQGKVAWVYRHLPLPFHTNAQKEAEASECANELGGNTAFWKYVNTLFQRTNSGGTGFPLKDLTPLAVEIGLDETKFQACLDSNKYTERVKNDQTEAVNLGVNGTPGNILLDTQTGKTKLMPGAYPFTDFQKAIDGLLSEL